MHLKIATFNVNGINGRLARLLEWLEEARPDVACLQEIKTGDATFPAEPLQAAGYHVLWHGMPRGLEQRLVIALILAWLLLAANWLRRQRAA